MSFTVKKEYICDLCGKSYSTVDEVVECCNETPFFHIVGFKMLNIDIVINKGQNINYFPELIFEAAIKFTMEDHARVYTVFVSGRDGKITFNDDPDSIIALIEMEENNFEHDISGHTFMLADMFIKNPVLEKVFFDSVMTFIDKNNLYLLEPLFESIDWSKNTWYEFYEE